MDLGTIIGIILGGVSFCMATPSFAQMLWGRPKLKIEVDEFTGSDGKAFLIKIKNEAVKNRFLRWIGVIREVGEVMAYFDIRERGTNKFIATDASGLMHCAATRNEGLLVRILAGFTVGFTVVHFNNSKAFVIDARAEKIEKTLEEGDYIIDAKIICGERAYGVTKNIRVGKEAHQTFWL